MYRASEVYRKHDKEHNGLDHHEWKKAMAKLGYDLEAVEDKHALWNQLDVAHTGKLTEKEFCEFWGYYGTSW